MTTIRFRIAGLAALLAFGCSAAYADWLQVSSLTTGTAGTFTGSLGGVAVTGGITASPANTLQLNGTSGTNSWEESNTTNTSPQYSYSSVYAYTIGGTDELGLTKFYSQTETGVLTINFAQPMTNVVLQIANLDAAVWDLSNTAGLTGLSILKGNGGGGDGLGLAVSGDTILDLNPTTQVGQNQSASPLTSGARSAYGSVELMGTYSSLVVDVAMNPNGISGDGFNFTLVSTPEPASMALLGVIVIWFSVKTWLRLRRSA